MKIDSIPYHILEDLRSSLGIDSDENSKDNIIISFTKKQILENVLSYNGFNDLNIEEILQLSPNQVDFYCDNKGIYGVDYIIKDILKM